LAAAFARSAAAASNSPSRPHRLDDLPDGSTNLTSRVASSGTRFRHDHDRAAAFQATSASSRARAAAGPVPDMDRDRSAATAGPGAVRQGIHHPGEDVAPALATMSGTET